MRTKLPVSKSQTKLRSRLKNPTLDRLMQLAYSKGVFFTSDQDYLIAQCYEVVLIRSEGNTCAISTSEMEENETSGSSRNVYTK